MNYLQSTIDYVLNAENWTGAMGLGALMTQHVGYSLLGVGVSALIGVPLGWWVGHTGKGRGMAVTVSGAVRALPTLGLITLFGLALGIGLRAPLLALVVLALPSVLAGAYTGIEAADRLAVDGARASGMSEAQVLTRVEIPLGAPQLNGLGAAHPHAITYFPLELRSSRRRWTSVTSSGAISVCRVTPSSP